MARKHPLALDAWFALALHGHAPIHLAALCGTLGVEELDAKHALAALVTYSLAERTEIPSEEVGQTEPGWQLTHVFLVEWAKQYEGGLSFYWSTCPSRRQELGISWVNFWGKLLHESTTKRYFPGGYSRFLAFQTAFGRLIELCRKNRHREGFWKVAPMMDIGLVELLFSNFLKAEAIFREESEASEKDLGIHHEHTSVALHNLGVALLEQGRQGEAIPVILKSLEGKEKSVGKESPLYLQTLKNLAAILQTQGNKAMAFTIHAQIWQKRREQLGPKHPDTLLSAMAIASYADDFETPNTALEILTRILDDFERELGLSRLETLMLAVVVAHRENALGKNTEALSRLDKALCILLPEFGEVHQQTLKAQRLKATILSATGQHVLAESIFRECRDKLGEKMGNDGKDFRAVSWELVQCLESQGRFDDAVEIVVQTKDALAGKANPEDDASLEAEERLGMLRIAMGEFAGAEEIHRKLLETRCRTKGESSSFVFISRHNLASALKLQGKVEEASIVLQPALQAMREERYKGSDLAIMIEHLHASILQKNGSMADAELALRAVCGMAESRYGVKHFKALAFKHDLALCLLEMNKLDEANLIMNDVLKAFEASLPDAHRSRLSARKWLTEIQQRQASGGKLPPSG